MSKVYFEKHNGLFDRGYAPSPFEDADICVFWDDIYQTQRDLITKAKAQNKTTILYEHGRDSLRLHIKNHGVIITDGVLVLGQYSKDRLLEYTNLHPNQIIVTGDKAFDSFYTGKQKKINNRKPLRIGVIAFKGFGEEREENYELIKALLSSKNPKDTIHVKENVVSKISKDRVIDPSIQYYFSHENATNHFEEIKNFLKNIDLLYSFNESTIELLARLQGIPLINVDLRDVGLIGNFNGQSHYVPLPRRSYQNRTTIFDIPQSLENARGNILKFPTPLELKYEVRLPGMSDEELLFNIQLLQESLPHIIEWRKRFVN